MKFVYICWLKVIVTVKSSWCLQIGSLIIDYICNFFIRPPKLQLIKFKSFKSLTSVSASLPRCPNRGKYITICYNPREFEAYKDTLVSEKRTLLSDKKLFKFD